ncbi:FtsX-like permease family protein [Micromonospora robiginosa]|uniref:FtsX-like permease family protein n=1 Tax=Micromonospora robiginosa TaxID=2749844 RepID=A0A7L6BAC8_9ACTN|nr:FtsX-like permease family protein [Micromonospora ferruginea]QLQ38835.1 FtsX-like permease family protein [Micromonospora ferruginea]
MRPGTLLRLALAGTRTDGARVALTALSAALATLAGLAALTVLAVARPTGDDGVNSEQYTNALLREPGLRPGVAFALLLLCVPVLGLAGQCARLGAPGRDRRLAALRLAGATPGQVTRLAVAETGVASLLGTLAGLAVFEVGRRLLHRPDAAGRLPLPTDVHPAPAAVAAVVLGLPLVAALAGALLLRRVTTTPFGVVRRVRTRAPWPWPGVLILVALALFAAIRPVGLWYERRGAVMPDSVVPLLVLLGGLTAMIGVVSGTGWISYTTGRLLHRHGRGAAALLAARRLTADPWAGSRTFAALLAALIFGAGAAALRADFQAEVELARRTGGGLSDPDFYLGAMDLVDLAVGVAVAIAAGGLLVAVVEGVTSRRRAYAAQVATGVPRSTIGRSLLWASIAPAVPAIALALTVGYLLIAGPMPAPSGGGFEQTACDPGWQACGSDGGATRTRWVPKVTVTPDVPWEQLAWFAAGGLAAVLLTAVAGLVLLRSATSVEELRAT